MTKTENPEAAKEVNKKATVSELVGKLFGKPGSMTSKQRIALIGEIILTATFGGKIRELDKRIEKNNSVANNKEKVNKPVAEDEKEEAIENPDNKPEGPGNRLADIAKSFIKVINPDFRTPDVKGGILACAKVVTTILQKAGLSDAIILSVDATARKLKKEGWKEVAKPPKPGDVIVWAPTGGYIRDPKGVSVAKGHRHIGIALNDTTAVSNSSRKKMAVEHNIFTKRPVEKILRAPTDMAA